MGGCESVLMSDDEVMGVIKIFFAATVDMAANRRRRRALKFG